MPLEKRINEAALTGKGFIRPEGDHHFFVTMTLQGRKSRVRTKTSHTHRMKEISDSLLGQMATPCGLTKPEFQDLVKCPLSREAYEKLLEERGKL